jgi:hypothetical protein
MSGQIGDGKGDRHRRCDSACPRGFAVASGIPCPLAFVAWVDMMAMRAIAPLGFFPSVLKAIEMVHVPHPIMITTDQMILGGAYSPQLLGPTPANLVPVNIAAIHMDAAPNPLPLNVRGSPNANQGHNWVT